MLGIERSWMIYEAHPVSEGELIEVVPAAEVERLRMKLEAVGRWLCSGNFAGWEMVVTEIEKTLDAS